MDLGLKGKVALVCAASRGLGRAVAEELAAEGAKVAICARREEDLRQAVSDIRNRIGGEVLSFQADVTSDGDVTRMVRDVSARWQTIHILVTNAGGPPAGGFDDCTLEQWRNATELNFLSAVRLCREVVPLMKEQRWGRIVHIASITVKQPVPGLTLSNAVRGSVAGLSKSLAMELAGFNILVNTVCPGYTRTARVEELAEAQASSSGRSAGEIFRTWERGIPLGRLAEPREFAALVAFLSSERASYITGTTIQVDGGYVSGVL